MDKNNIGLRYILFCIVALLAMSIQGCSRTIKLSKEFNVCLKSPGNYEVIQDRKALDHNDIVVGNRANQIRIYIGTQPAQAYASNDLVREYESGKTGFVKIATPTDQIGKSVVWFGSDGKVGHTFYVVAYSDDSEAIKPLKDKASIRVCNKAD